jgi:hypothetical protein
MLKTTALAAALVTAAASPTLAEPPADKEACNKLAVDLAKNPKSAALSEADYVKFYGSILALSQACEEEDFVGAGAIADQIEAVLK